MFRISSSSWKLEAVFLKTGYLQLKNSEQKNPLSENTCLLKNCYKKIKLYYILNVQYSCKKKSNSELLNDTCQ